MSEPLRVPAGELRGFVQAVFEVAGLRRLNAARMADALIWADLRGLEPHGVAKLPLWVERLRAGGTPPGAEPTLVADSETTAVVDAGGAFGQLAGAKAMELAADKAARRRLGAVVIRDSSSLGAMGYYPLIAVRRDLIGLAITNSTPLLAPTGGTARVLGNQAYSIGSPARERFPLLLDVSNGATSWGRVKLAAERGEQLAPGLALDRHGRPTVDPAAALEGLLQPVGGHKGYGLAVMWEVLTGVLAGLAFGSNVGGPEEVGRRSEIAGFMLALDPAAFLPLAAFKARVDSLIDQLHATPRAAGVERIYAPGERGFLLAAEREREGIPLSAQRVAELRRLADGCGVAAPW